MDLSSEEPSRHGQTSILPFQRQRRRPQVNSGGSPVRDTSSETVFGTNHAGEVGCKLGRPDVYFRGHTSSEPTPGYYRTISQPKQPKQMLPSMETWTERVVKCLHMIPGLEDPGYMKRPKTRKTTIDAFWRLYSSVQIHDRRLPDYNTFLVQPHEDFYKTFMTNRSSKFPKENPTFEQLDNANFERRA
ncbi:MAG: hypothetical protein M1820_006603 [Bogoriella megaspora]|nr:MAG: hypothetical protein M1820_006603 [Bogoriella megaspora]